MSTLAGSIDPAIAGRRSPEAQGTQWRVARRSTRRPQPPRADLWPDHLPWPAAGLVLSPVAADRQDPSRLLRRRPPTGRPGRYTPAQNLRQTDAPTTPGNHAHVPAQALRATLWSCRCPPRPRSPMPQDPPQPIPGSRQLREVPPNDSHPVWAHLKHRRSGASRLLNVR